MSIKATRGTDFNQLTATVAVQSVTMESSYRNIIVRTSSLNDLRISINGKPENLSGSNGILVSQGNPLEISNHMIHEIKYIRESAAPIDVNFDILGLYHERNTSPISDKS